MEELKYDNFRMDFNIFIVIKPHMYYYINEK